MVLISRTDVSAYWGKIREVGRQNIYFTFLFSWLYRTRIWQQRLKNFHGWFLVFNTTFSNISASLNIMATSFSSGRSQNTRRTTNHGQATGKLITCGCESSASFFVIYKAGRKPTPYWR